jgi:hypothetical protein
MERIIFREMNKRAVSSSKYIKKSRLNNIQREVDIVMNPFPFFSRLSSSRLETVSSKITLYRLDVFSIVRF